MMSNISVISYSLGAVLHLIFGLLLCTGWRGRMRGTLLVLAVFFNVIWCAANAYNAIDAQLTFPQVYLLETFRLGLWLLFLASLINRGRIFLLFRGGVVLSTALVWVATLIVSAAVFFTDFGSKPDSLPGLPLGLQLILVLFGLSMIEQLYRGTAANKRWRIKFLCIGVGGLLVYDFYLYSQALLFRNFDLITWSARGAVNAIIVPFIAVSVARNPQWSLDIFVSRHVIFYTGTFISAGVYLLMMAVGGYYIREYGGSWSGFLQIIFLFGAGLVLFVAIMSTQLRSYVKQFLSEHFFSNKYDYRREWLRLIDILSSPEGNLTLHQRAIKAISQIVQARGGMLWLKYGMKNYMPIAMWHMQDPDDACESINSEFIRYMISNKKIIDLSDSTEKKSFNHLPVWLNQIDNAWLVIPLLHENQLLGFIVLSHTDYSPRITWEDTDLLKTVGQQIASYLLQYEVASQLAEARQFEAYNQLTAFIIHDLKNLISQLSLVVQNSSAHKNNPAFIEDTIETIDNSVHYMGRLINQLRKGKADISVERVNLAELLNDVVVQCSEKKPCPQLLSNGESIHVSADKERLAMMFRHLIHNAQDATKSDGFVKISMDQDEEYIVVKVEDSGFGMDREFIADRLFKPFDSTKGAKGMGIGAYEVRNYIRSIGGEVFVKSQLGKGSQFTLFLPVNSSFEEQLAFGQVNSL